MSLTKELNIDKSRNFYLQLTPLNELVVLYEDEFENTYKLLRYGVGGCIESFEYFKSLYLLGIDTWCNDEGKLIGLEPSIVLCQEGYEKPNVVSSINGNIIFSRSNAEGETLPLREEDIKTIANMFLNGKSQDDKMAMGIFRVGSKIRKLPMLFYESW